MLALRILLILAAAACVLLSVLASADPEGRGADLIPKLWGGTVGCIAALVASLFIR